MICLIADTLQLYEKHALFWVRRYSTSGWGFMISNKVAWFVRFNYSIDVNRPKRQN